MTPRLRSKLTVLPLGIQLFAAITAVGAINFVHSSMVTLLEEHRGQIELSSVSRLFLYHPTIARGIVFGLFALSCVGYYWTRKKIKDEADQILIQGIVQSVVWPLAIVYVSGAIMAGMQPYFLVHSLIGVP